MGVDETNGAISRREALKTTAKAAGVAAFVAPVVVGVFSAQSVSAAVCNSNDSDAEPGIITSNTVTWNTNCGPQDGDFGRYNGQDKNFTIDAGAGSVFVGGSGNDNFGTQNSFYTIDAPTGYTCTASFELDCNGTSAMSTVPIGAPAGALSLPYCLTCASTKLDLISVVCCPTA
jgi:hypothetical protein